MCNTHVHTTPRARVYPPRLGELGDTFEACEGTKHSAFIYCHGSVEPHYPVPAVLTSVEVNTWDAEGPFHNTICIFEYSGYCDECGGSAKLAAIWDYNFDRCMDFHYPCGVYVHGNAIEEGTAKYRRGE